MYRIAGFIFFAFQRCGDRVREVARRHVGRGDDVGRRGGDRRACRYILKRALRKRDAIDLAERDRDRLVVYVLHRNRKGYGFAFLIFIVVCLTVVLRYDQRRIRRFGDRQRADRIIDRVVALDRRAVPVQRVRVVALANQRLAARDRERRRLLLTAVRRYETGDAAGLRQRFAVVFLLAAFRYDRQRRRRYLQRAFGRGVLIVRVGRLYHVGDRTVRNVRDARDRIDPGLTAVETVLDRRALGHARCCAAIMRVAVIDALIIDRRDRHGRLGDRQGAGVEGRFFIEFLNVLILGIHNGERRAECTVLIGIYVRAVRRGIGNRQDVALTETFDLVILGLDRFTGTGDGSNERTTFLLAAVVHLFDGLDRDGKCRRGDRQGTEFFLYSIVVRVDRAPVDQVGILAVADLGLTAGCGDGDNAFIRRNETGKRRYVFRQRRAVVCLAVAARGDHQLFRDDLQAAGTDVQADAVVAAAIRHLRRRQIQRVGIVADVLFVFYIISQTCCSARMNITQALNHLDNIIKIFGGIARMADHDVLVPRHLARVGEAGQIRFAGIRRVRPTVGLNTNRNVDRGDFERTVDVANRIIIRVLMRRGDRCVLRRDRRDARVQATHGIGRIVVRISELDTGQRIAFLQTVHDDLVRESCGQRQRSAIVRLAGADGGDGDLLLIIEGKGQSVRRVRFRNLIGRTCLRAAVRGAFDRLVELPAGDRRARQSKGLADLHVLHIRSRDRSAVHVDEVDRDKRVLVARINERIDVVRFDRRQNEGLFGRIREELDVLEFGMRRIERRIIDRLCKLDDGCRVAGNVIDRLFLRNRDITCVLFRVDDVSDLVAGLIALYSVDKGDHVVFNRKLDRLRIGLRTVARDRDRGFRDALTDREVRVGDFLVRRDRIAVFIHIVDDVAQRRAGPVRIDRGIRRDLHTEVKQIVAVRRGVPAVEDVARLGGCAGVRRLLVLFDRLIRKQIRRSGFTVYKADRKARRRPLGIEHQIGCRHLGEGILCGQTGIGIPTRERVVAVYAALRRGGRPDVRGLVDVRVELNILDRIEQIAAVVIVDLVSISIIIEIVRGNGSRPVRRIIRMIIRITSNFLRTVRTGRRGLAVQSRQCITIIVCVLQIIIYLNCAAAGTPSTGNRYTRSIVRKQGIGNL